MLHRNRPCRIEEVRDGGSEASTLLDALAKDSGITRAQVIRQLAAEGLLARRTVDKGRERGSD